MMIPKSMLHYTLDDAFRIICKPYSMQIIRNMTTLKYSKFNQFSHSIKGINPNTLASRLQELQDAKIIERKIYDETPVRVEYSLTKKGKNILPILEKMISFSLKHKK